MATKPREGVFFDTNMVGNKALKELYQKAKLEVSRPVNKEEKKCKNLINGIVQEGERNTTLTRYAGRLKAWNIPEGEAFKILSAMDHAGCIPPLDNKEMVSITKSVYRYESNRFEIKTTSFKELVGKKSHT